MTKTTEATTKPVPAYKKPSCRKIIDLRDINPDAVYPLKDACKFIYMSYATALNRCKDGTFPLPRKKIHTKLTLIKGSDIIKHLEGGDWIKPKQPAYKEVG